MLEGIRGYLQIASGLTEVPRHRATAAVRTLVSQGESQLAAVLPEDLLSQVGELTDDLVATSRANRDLLLGVVRGEVERQVARLGLVSAAEVEAATGRADRLERRLQELEVQLAAREDGAPAPTTGPRPTAKRASSSTRAGTGPGRAAPEGRGRAAGPVPEAGPGRPPAVRPGLIPPLDPAATDVPRAGRSGAVGRPAPEPRPRNARAQEPRRGGPDAEPKAAKKSAAGPRGRRATGPGRSAAEGLPDGAGGPAGAGSAGGAASAGDGPAGAL